MTFDPVKHFERLHANHIDGNSLNNTLGNLEWLTPKENIKHSYGIGINHDNKRATMVIHVDSAKLHHFESLVKMHEFVIEHTNINCGVRHIGNLCKSRVIRDGYEFLYADDVVYEDKVDNLEGEMWKLYCKGKKGWKYFVSNLARVKVVYQSKKERLVKPFDATGSACKECLFSQFSQI